jgi:hypothetical protein
MDSMKPQVNARTVHLLIIAEPILSLVLAQLVINVTLPSVQKVQTVFLTLLVPNVLKELIAIDTIQFQLIAHGKLCQ